MASTLPPSDARNRRRLKNERCFVTDFVKESISLFISTGATSLQNLAGASGITSDRLALGAFLGGYHYAFLVTGGVAFAGVLISLWLARRKELGDDSKT